MKKEIPLLDENKKRAAYKRFSQMSAAGLAVISMSAFADVSANPLPANTENCAVKERNVTLLNARNVKSLAITDKMFSYSESEDPDTDSDTDTGDDNEDYGNAYSNIYFNIHSDHSDYSNNYADDCDPI